jgi:hypothetical protein
MGWSNFFIQEQARIFSFWIFGLGEIDPVFPDTFVFPGFCGVCSGKVALHRIKPPGEGDKLRRTLLKSWLKSSPTIMKGRGGMRRKRWDGWEIPGP